MRHTDSPERELGWVVKLLDMHGVPTESYEGQAGGVCGWTVAGRVDHVLKLLDKHGISPTEDVIPADPDERKAWLMARGARAAT